MHRMSRFPFDEVRGLLARGGPESELLRSQHHHLVPSISLPSLSASHQLRTSIFLLSLARVPRAFNGQCSGYIIHLKKRDGTAASAEARLRNCTLQLKIESHPSTADARYDSDINPCVACCGPGKAVVECRQMRPACHLNSSMTWVTFLKPLEITILSFLYSNDPFFAACISFNLLSFNQHTAVQSHITLTTKKTYLQGQIAPLKATFSWSTVYRVVTCNVHTPIISMEQPDHPKRVRLYLQDAFQGNGSRRLVRLAGFLTPASSFNGMHRTIKRSRQTDLHHWIEIEMKNEDIREATIQQVQQALRVRHVDDTPAAPPVVQSIFNLDFSEWVDRMVFSKAVSLGADSIGTPLALGQLTARLDAMGVCPGHCLA